MRAQAKQSQTSLSFGLILTCLMAILPTCAFSDTLRIATDEWCPYDCISSQNQGKVGYLGDLMAEALKARGHEVEFVEVSYYRGLQLIRKANWTAPWPAFDKKRRISCFPIFR